MGVWSSLSASLMLLSSSISSIGSICMVRNGLKFFFCSFSFPYILFRPAAFQWLSFYCATMPSVFERAGLGFGVRFDSVRTSTPLASVYLRISFFLEPGPNCFFCFLEFLNSDHSACSDSKFCSSGPSWKGYGACSPAISFIYYRSFSAFSWDVSSVFRVSKIFFLLFFLIAFPISCSLRIYACFASSVSLFRSNP